VLVLGYAVFVVGCGKPMIVKFNVGIPSNATAPTGDVLRSKGLPTSARYFRRSVWTVKGARRAVSITREALQPPACFNYSQSGGTGTKRYE